METHNRQDSRKHLLLLLNLKMNETQPLLHNKVGRLHLECVTTANLSLKLMFWAWPVRLFNQHLLQIHADLMIKEGECSDFYFLHVAFEWFRELLEVFSWKQISRISVMLFFFVVSLNRKQEHQKVSFEPLSMLSCVLFLASPHVPRFASQLQVLRPCSSSSSSDP